MILIKSKINFKLYFFFCLVGYSKLKSKVVQYFRKELNLANQSPSDPELGLIFCVTTLYQRFGLVRIEVKSEIHISEMASKGRN